MDYFLGAVSLVSLILNYLMFQKVRESEVRLIEKVTAEQVDFETNILPCCAESIVEEPKEVIPEDPSPVEEDKEKYQIWRNIKGEPQYVAPKPSFNQPPPTPGPLQRPQGFV